MSAFRIRINRLPPDVFQQILRVTDRGKLDSRWRLLRSGNTRRTYHFSPGSGDDSYVVKWGYRCFSSAKKIVNILAGRDDACVEWEKTRRAADHGVRVLDFDLVASPRWERGCFQTLLVTRFLDRSQNAIQFLERNVKRAHRTHTFLRALAVEVAGLHKQSLLHRDLSLDNILVRDPDDGDILLIDWMKSEPLYAPHETAWTIDLIAPLSDMLYTGLTEDALRFFLTTYSEIMGWSTNRIDDLIGIAKKNRADTCRRAFQNCTRRNRQVIQYKHRGYKVYQLKGADSAGVREWLETDPPSQPVPKSADENASTPVDRWRTANFLHKTGLLGHSVAAYAVRGGAGESVCTQDPPGAVKISNILLARGESRDPEIRSIRPQEVLTDAGDFLRRLELCGMSIRHFDPSRWYCLPADEGRTQFYTDDPDVYVALERGPLEEPFAWLADERWRPLGVKGLIRFMRGFCAGSADREFVRKVLERTGDLEQVSKVPR